MRRATFPIATRWRSSLATALLLALCKSATAQSGDASVGHSPTKKAPPDSGHVLEIYGSSQGDMIYDFRVNDPSWFDVNRPTKLPSVPGEFGGDHRTWFSARQSRFGVKSRLPTDHGDVTTQFEFDLFGVGDHAGQTTFQLRTAYGQWGHFGGGQLASPFMDEDVFPNILDYWGPNGMVFYRNVQIFWRPIDHDSTRLTFALERPGATGDAGAYARRVELQNVVARFPLPDLSGEYRLGRPWGYVELAGVVRSIHWDDVLADSFDLGGKGTGWGVNLSSNVNVSKHDVLRLQSMYGKGVENYLNDAPVDIGITNNFSNRRRPILGTLLPDLGLVAYLDHQWSATWSSSLGWSEVTITNSDGQAAVAFHRGQYASVNALCTPVPGFTMGAEFQWGYRRNFADGLSTNDFRVEASLRYDFSASIVRQRSARDP